MLACADQLRYIGGVTTPTYQTSNDSLAVRRANSLRGVTVRSGRHPWSDPMTHIERYCRARLYERAAMCLGRLSRRALLFNDPFTRRIVRLELQAIISEFSHRAANHGRLYRSGIR